MRQNEWWFCGDGCCCFFFFFYMKMIWCNNCGNFIAVNFLMVVNGCKYSELIFTKKFLFFTLTWHYLNGNNNGDDNYC